MVEELFSGLGPETAPSVRGLLERVSELYEASSDPSEQGEEEAALLAKSSLAVLGAAIRSMGPRAVLGVLPLALQVIRAPDSTSRHTACPTICVLGWGRLPQQHRLCDRTVKAA